MLMKPLTFFHLESNVKCYPRYCHKSNSYKANPIIRQSIAATAGCKFACNERAVNSKSATSLLLYFYCQQEILVEFTSSYAKIMWLVLHESTFLHLPLALL